MLEFLLRYPQKLYEPLLQHLAITAVTLAVSLLIAALLCALLMRSRVLSQAAVGFFSVVYSIPSLALFALLIPVFGLGRRTAVFVLVLYNQFLLVRNILEGFAGIDPCLIEAAQGMGMSEAQLFFRIRLPLAMPSILAGVRLAIISTIGIATIAATINAGGLGVLLFDGLRTRNPVKIAWGALLSSLLAIAANQLLAFITKRLQRNINGI